MEKKKIQSEIDEKNQLIYEMVRGSRNKFMTILEPDINSNDLNIVKELENLEYLRNKLSSNNF